MSPYPPASAVVTLSLLLLGIVPQRIFADQTKAIREFQDISEIAHFVLNDGWLDVQFTPPAGLAKPDAVPFRIKGCNARWAFRVSQSPIDGEMFNTDEPVQELTYEDAGAPDQPGHAHTTVSRSGRCLLISATIYMDGQQILVRYRGRGDVGTAQIEAYLQREGEIGEPLMDMQADSLQELIDQNAQDFEHYFRPVLRKLARRNLLGPGATDVFGVFSDIRPDPRVLGQYGRMLPLLDDPDVAVRNHANDELKRLGPPGVLAAMRCDRRDLTPEQNARLSDYIEQHRRRWILDIPTARRNLAFLVDCLEDENPIVRQAAKAAFEESVGKPIRFDPARGWDDRAAAIDALRKDYNLQ